MSIEQAENKVSNLMDELAGHLSSDNAKVTKNLDKETYACTFDVSKGNMNEAVTAKIDQTARMILKSSPNQTTDTTINHNISKIQAGRELQKQVETSAANISLARGELNQAKLRMHLTDATKALGTANDERDAAKATNMQLHSTLQVTKNKLGETEQQLSASHTEVDGLKEDKQALEGEISGLQLQLKTKGSENTQLQAQIKELQAQVASKDLKINELSENIGKLQLQNTALKVEHKATIASLEKTHEAETEGATAAHAVAIASLSETHKGAIANLGETHKGAIEALSKEHTTAMTAATQEGDAKTKKLRAKYTQVTAAQKEKYTSELSELKEGQKADSTQMEVDYQDQISNLKEAQSSQIEQLTQGHEDQISNLDQQVEGLVQRLSNAKKETEATQNKLDSALSENESLDEDNKALKSTLAVKEKGLQENDKLISAKEAKIVEQQGELKANKLEIETLTKTKALNENTISTQAHKINKLQEQYKASDSEYQQAYADVQAKKEEISSLKSQLCTANEYTNQMMKTAGEAVDVLNSNHKQAIEEANETLKKELAKGQALQTAVSTQGEAAKAGILESLKRVGKSETDSEMQDVLDELAIQIERTQVTSDASDEAVLVEREARLAESLLENALLTGEESAENNLKAVKAMTAEALVGIY